MAIIHNETSYHTDLFEKGTQTVDLAAEFVAISGCDSIIGTGISGLAPLMMLSFVTDVPWAVARKQGDTIHCTHSVVGPIGEKVLIVDDFIESGRTVRSVIEAIERELHTWRCGWRGLGPTETPEVFVVGVLEYGRNSGMRITPIRDLRQKRAFEESEDLHHVCF